MPDAEDLQLLFVEADAAEHQPVAAQGLDRVDAHAAHHLLDLVLPGRDQIHEPSAADVGIQTLDEVGPLGRDAPVALAGLAASAQVAAQREQRRRADVAGVTDGRDYGFIWF